MMDAAALLSTLRERQVRLWIDGTQLKCSAPVGAMDRGLREALASRKQEIILALQQADVLKSGPTGVVPIKPEGRLAPIFVVPGHAGDVFCFLPLARQLDPDQPMVGIQPPGLDGTEPLKSVEALAANMVEQIRRYRASGPYLLAGYCAGGPVAFEMARQLAQTGEEVPFVGLIGAPFPAMFAKNSLLRVRLSGYSEALTPVGFWRRLKRRRERQKREDLVSPASRAARQKVEAATVAAVRSYAPKPYRGEIDLFITAEKWHQPELWGPFASRLRKHNLQSFQVNDLLFGEHAHILARHFQERLDQVWGATGLVHLNETNMTHLT